MLTVYDEHMRGVEPKPRAGVRYERDGPLLRVVGGRRGFISGPRDVGVTGAELDWLVARQRDYFAGRVRPSGGRSARTTSRPTSPHACAPRDSFPGRRTKS